MKEPCLPLNGTMRRYVLWMLLAVELLMSFSFLGYFHVPPISVTTAYIPVLLAGALTGPLEAAAVGAVFGLASMWKASASYVMATDQMFSPLYSGNPLGSLVLSVGARLLFGLVVGLLYLAVRRLPHPGLWVGVVSFFGRTVHSLLVYSAMALFFPQAGYGPASALSALARPMDLVSNLITMVIVLLFWRLARSRAWGQFQSRVALARTLQEEEPHHRLPLAVVLVLTLAGALAVTAYFVHRIDYVLGAGGIELSNINYSDVLHLQVQFLLGIVSMMVLVALFLVLNRLYTSYAAYEGKLDSLTGVMTRRPFFTSCGRVLPTLEGQGGPLGYFIMVDIDCFKEINDSYGHPEGDRALKETVRLLRETFPRGSLIGRLGGDEFALLVHEAASPAELEVALRHFLDRVHRVTWEQHRLTCSIGALPILRPRPPEELYLEADRLLYAAKERGRDQYVIGAAEPV